MIIHNISSTSFFILIAFTFESIIASNYAIAEQKSFENYKTLSTTFEADKPIVEKLQGLNDQLFILERHVQSRVQSKLNLY
tara:strand:+ start:1137 stop:1379 length:243 start_codon:yes stop_codon:yes gene_type:complete